MLLADMVVTVRELLPAPVEEVFALLTDVQRMGGLGPENTSSAWRDEQRGVGAVFLGANQRGDLQWEVPCTVVEHVPPHRFAWLVGDPALPSATWGYDLRAADGGTSVTQEFRLGRGRSFLRAACRAEPAREQELVAGRAGEIEQGMRGTLRAAADLLRG